MAPETRSQTARIAGFPDVQDGEPVEKTRPLNTTNGNAEQQTEDTIKAESKLFKAQNWGKDAMKDSSTPPIYQIDLSLPPEQRYAEVARDYKEQAVALTPLFKEVVTGMGLPYKTVNFFSKFLLRRVFSDEQTREIRGISKITSVPMYLLVALNVLLDLFMGCTSGGIKAQDPSSPGNSRMLHFRTLDWGMDGLRKLIVQLEFLDRPKGEVIARSITYCGFVGVLTGVRPGLSVSLNFRPNHNDSDKTSANIAYYYNHLMILLGRRPSIASLLRDVIIPADFHNKTSSRTLESLDDITKTLPTKETTAAYITLSDGSTTSVIEKDRVTGTLRTSSTFITITNHDLEHEAHPPPKKENLTQKDISLGMGDLLAESTDRKACISTKWANAVKRAKRNAKTMGEEAAKGWTEEQYEGVQQRTIIRWTQEYPTTNEETHYACVMDPKKGEFVWLCRWLKPLTFEGEAAEEQI